jgi:uncharacterized protein YbjT (DUF2867 family)/membrane protease YdiL (CAAX protease family)
MRVLVAGASGFVGSRLTRALAEAGHDVAAMTRKPDRYHGAGTAVFGDVHDPATLGPALTGCEAAYYLVHSLSDPDFCRKDGAAAEAFGRAAAASGARRIIYLGGLGDEGDALSAHLSSRRDVERRLAAGGVPVTVLRAGIIVGNGGLSWELTRQLVEHLPAMITPRWVSTRTQPIAVDDVIRYLTAVLSRPETAGRIFEVGGPEVMRYAEMLQRVAAMKRRPLPILPVPLLSPRLSSLWLRLVTDVDPATGRSLIDSMINEVVVRDPAIRQLIPFDLIPYDEAIRIAMRERQDSSGQPMTRSRMHAPAPHIRRRIRGSTLAAGAGLLAASLSAEGDDPLFYALALALAGTWTGGALASGPVPAGNVVTRPSLQAVAEPVLVGAGTFGLFYAAARIARRSPLLNRAISSVLGYVDTGPMSMVLPTACVNGAAEELFFHGALWDEAGPERPAVTTALVYTAATVATRNPALVIGGAVTSLIFGQQRRRSGGVVAPALAHMTWSALILTLLPPLFRDQPPGSAAAGSRSGETPGAGRRLATRRGLSGREPARTTAATRA